MIQQAVRILRGGGLVAFPTETVYGLGADATNAAAIERVFAVKGRPSNNPLIVHVADEQVARRYAANWPAQANLLARRFWPGPLTLVVARSPLIVPAVTAGRPTVGLRCPDHPLTLDLLRHFDGPLAGPSANTSSRVSPTTAQHVLQELGGRIDMVLDGGPCQVGIESTVLDLSGGAPRILRPGAVSAGQIESVLGVPVAIVGPELSDAQAAVSPGRQPIHYAPRTPAFRFEPPEDAPASAEVGLVILGEHQPTTGNVVVLPPRPEAYARRLYATLRDLDARGLSAIYIQMPPDTPAWTAVRDRLIRGTRPMPAKG